MADANDSKTATELKDNAVETQNLAPAFDQESADALDSLMAQKEKEGQAKLVEIEPKEGADPDPKPGEGEVKPADGETKPLGSEEKPAEGEVKPAEAATAPKEGDDIFGDVQLPPHARPKSAEAFNQIKQRAVQEISKIAGERDSLAKKVEELSSQLKDPVPAELKQEVEDLRNFRAKLDVQFDPKFKEFDSKLEQANQSVYAFLRSRKVVTDAEVKAIEGYGGITGINLESFLTGVTDPVARRFIETKATEIESLKVAKSEAVREAETNLSDYLKARGAEIGRQKEGVTAEVQSKLESLLTHFDWIKERSAAAGATEEEAKKAEEHNTFVRETKQAIKAAMSDDSPDMRAVLLAGTAQLLHVKRAFAAEKARAESLEKQNVELSKTLERIKQSSAGRLRESAAPAKAEAAAPAKPVFDANPGDALDAIAREVIAKRAENRA